MQLTQESSGTRWLVMIATWSLCALVVVLHTRTTNDYVARLDHLGLRDGAPVATPMRHVVPARHADTQMWVRHALTGQASGEARVRFTMDDNAPHGREVHWASPLLWILRSAGRSTDIEQAITRLNTPLFLSLLVVFSGWIALRAGAGAGMLVALAMVGHNRFYASFAPGNVDHHGLLTVCVLGLITGLIFMSAGWWKPNLGGTFTTLMPSELGSARRAAIVSATCGAVGLWISAASMLPAIAIGGAAGLFVALWQGGAALRDAARFEPDLWRLWGRVGAALSVGFYLIEYAPSHLGMRLEVNHPFYALAWWGGAEIVATLAELKLDRSIVVRRRAARRLILPVLAVLLVPVALYLGGQRVFALGDPFIADLRHFVLEGKSLPAAVRSFGFGAVAYPVVSCLLLIPAITIGWRARGEGATLLAFSSVVAAAFMALGFWEMRWWLVGSATQIALLLVVIATTRHRWTWVLLVSALVFLPSAILRINTVRASIKNDVVDQRDVVQPIYRDIAAALRATQPEGDITLLASPNASMGIGYYGGFKTIGTLFWENVAGLKAAAAIFSAPTHEEAAALVRARGITHVAMVSSASFLTEYFQLLNPGADVAGVKATFGHRLATQRADVPWLQPIAYRPPNDLAFAQTKVSLFKVAFEQTEMERHYHAAIALAAAGDLPAAEATLNETLDRIPADTRFVFAESVGSAWYDYGADAAAVRAFRRALEFKFDPGVATTTAWILATTADASLRDGRTALALIDPVAQGDLNDPTVLSALAAALAEVGRFPDAVVMAERALAKVPSSEDPAMHELLQRRLTSYQANRPWRQ